MSSAPYFPHPASPDPDVAPTTPFGPGPAEWPTSTELTHGVGHAGPYFPYDMEDPRAPVREKRAPGFVTTEDYIRGGTVKQYKRARRPPKRAGRE